MADKAEQILAQKGFSQSRVRIHGSVARIEVPPQDFARFADEDLRRQIHEEFRVIGFAYTALDLLGYRTGSLNEALPQNK